MDKGHLLALGSLEQLREQIFNHYKVIIETDLMPETIQSKKIEEDTYELSFKEKAEVSQLVKKIVQAGGNISQVRPMDYSLEDIYFALLEGGEKNVQ